MRSLISAGSSRSLHGPDGAELEAEVAWERRLKWSGEIRRVRRPFLYFALGVGLPYGRVLDGPDGGSKVIISALVVMLLE